MKKVKIRVVDHKNQLIAYHNEIKSIEEAIEFLKKQQIIDSIKK